MSRHDELEPRREIAIGRLRAAYTEGLMSVETYEFRVEGALAARSRVLLDQVLWDLEASVARWRGDALVLLDRWARRTGRTSVATGRWDIDLAALADGARQRSWTVGRASGCDVHIACPSVSRLHAELSLRGGIWRLRDLGSTNGTWTGVHRVTGIRLDERLPLRLGDAELCWRRV